MLALAGLLSHVEDHTSKYASTDQTEDGESSTHGYLVLQETGSGVSAAIRIMDSSIN